MDTACEQRLMQHSTYLDDLIGMVPAKFYLPVNPDEMARKFQKHTGKPATAAVKHQHKLEATARRRTKLDPTKQLGAVEQAVANARAEAEEDEQFRLNESQRGVADAGDGDDDDDDATLGGALAPAMPAADFAQRGDGSKQLGAQELRRKLAERLQQLRGGRGGSAESRSDPKVKVVPKPKHNAAARAAGAGAASSSATGADATVAPAPAAASSRASAGALEFNQIHAGGVGANGKRKVRPPDLMALAAGAGSGEKRSKGAGRSVEGEGEDAQIDVWQKALEKAGGIKQRDDPKLLKKMLKKKERLKKKSQKEWKARVKGVRTEMLDRQTKRKDNLKGRMTKSKAKVAKAKAAAAGQDRAGFEGRKKTFLN